MGLQFGQLYKLRGIVYYKISPFEQRALAGVLRQGPKNIIRNISDNIMVIGIPFGLGFIFYQTMEAQHEQYLRKDPEHYKDDV